MLRNYVMFLGFIMFVFPAQTRGYDFLDPDAPRKLFTPSEHVHVLPKYSSLGEGLEIRNPLSESISWRYEYYGYATRKHITRNNVVLNASEMLRSSGLLLDWHPFVGIFRISAGIIAGKHELTGSAYYDRTYAQSGQSLTTGDLLLDLNTAYASSRSDPQLEQYMIASQALAPDTVIMLDDASVSAKDLVQAQARVTFSNTMPYFGIGWGNTIKKPVRFRYSIDFGLVYHGQPDVELTLTGPIADAADRYAEAELRTYLQNEEQKLAKELGKYRYYPVISAGLSYLF
ncbi:MAG: hypothetical protein BMS9Abin33_0073 [Gammaproteobacteria bacterium]|nr:MAG: hypothetical protein BMS9Abin33_0073 [Gammaproteobacteria bacterium]